MLHEADLPGTFRTDADIAVDTEAMGLDVRRDALCLVQLCTKDEVHLVRMKRPEYPCPNLKRVLSDPSVTKIFHFARFDMAMIRRWLGIVCTPVYCTKIASRLARTYTDRHGLKELAREMIGVDMAKAQQSSDWGAATLSQAQLTYAAQDVLHLHALRGKLDAILAREGRTELAHACFEALHTRVALDLAGWPHEDIFAH